MFACAYNHSKNMRNFFRLYVLITSNRYLSEYCVVWYTFARSHYASLLLLFFIHIKFHSFHLCYVYAALCYYVKLADVVVADHSTYILPANTHTHKQHTNRHVKHEWKRSRTVQTVQICRSRCTIHCCLEWRYNNIYVSWLWILLNEFNPLHNPQPLGISS